MLRKILLAAGNKFVTALPALLTAAFVSSPLGSEAVAQTVKIGVINSSSGFTAQAGDEMEKGINLYVKTHEKDLPLGVKVELIRRDDTGPGIGQDHADLDGLGVRRRAGRQCAQGDQPDEMMQTWTHGAFPLCAAAR